MRAKGKTGILLVNTGSTAAPRTRETRAYLREFLSDPRMLDVPAVQRWLVLNLFILPFRPKRSAEAYAKVWTEQGAPLLVISREVEEGLRVRMPEFAFSTAMRYGEPSIAAGVETLLSQDIERLIVAPMFPQYASAATGSVLEKVFEEVGRRWNVLPLTVLPPFYDDPRFLDAAAEVSRPALESFKPDHVILSYHGLPERQVRKSDPTGAHCLVKEGCCGEIGPANRFCYRAHCVTTTRELAVRLGLAPEQHTMTFQSRLGRDPWLGPATDATIAEMGRRGVKRLAVLCPSFVADCLETLEEIGMAGRETFLEAGGGDYLQAPCVNASEAWLDGLAEMLRQL